MPNRRDHVTIPYGVVRDLYTVNAVAIGVMLDVHLYRVGEYYRLEP